nr:Rv3654c family TadE-like protein [Amycolatopsis anabasis]
MSADAGMATVWTAAAIAGLLLVTGLLCWLGSAALARHRASGAADLAALAAAGRARDGVGVACERASWVVWRMGARLISCRLDGPDALVEVECPLSGALNGFAPAAARARAGPVDRSPTPVYGER